MAPSNISVYDLQKQVLVIAEPNLKLFLNFFFKCAKHSAFKNDQGNPLSRFRRSRETPFRCQPCSVYRKRTFHKVPFTEQISRLAVYILKVKIQTTQVAMSRYQTLI